MDVYNQLRQQARQKRDKAIRAARLNYRQAIREISRLRRLIGHKQFNATPFMARPRKLRRINGKTGGFSELTAIEAAEHVLRESGPMRLTELTLEVQRRGCRTLDNPRKVANAIRSAMRYHRARFKRDEAGRWAVHSCSGDTVNNISTAQ